jgi:cbb3-type cytochrome oxidase maturation protein
MNIVTILILASLLVALAFLGFFIWAVRNGQYEDTLTPSMRMLGDDDSASGGNKNSSAFPPGEKERNGSETTKIQKHD